MVKFLVQTPRLGVVYSDLAHVLLARSVDMFPPDTCRCFQSLPSYWEAVQGVTFTVSSAAVTIVFSKAAG